MEKLVSEFSVGLFFWQTLLFLILLFLLKKYAWKPILDAVNEREGKIQGALDAANEAEVKMAELTSQNENLLKEARIERDAILKEAKEVKNSMIAEAKSEATDAANKVMEDAKSQMEMEKGKAVAELKGQVATLSIEIAEKILKGELSDKAKQESVVNNLIEDVNLN